MIIKNGLVVDPALGLSEKMDLAIENGTILKIGKNIDTDQVSNDTEVLDATGLVVAPGLIDTHVHFRDPGFTYKEDLHTGALAAADLVIFDPEECWKPGDYASKSCNTPFTGQELFGKVKYTICGGKTVYSDK